MPLIGHTIIKNCRNDEIREVRCSSHIPKKVIKKAISEGLDIDDYLINSIGNITLIHEEINSSIGDTTPEEYLPEYESYLKEHLIPEDEDLWRLKTLKNL